MNVPDNQPTNPPQGGSGLKPAMPDRIEHWFKYHGPTDDQFDRYLRLRREAKAFAHTINELCPDSADKTAAIRKVREAVMTANAAIACGGK